MEYKYFVKWLPVEGKIKKGDVGKHIVTGNIFISEEEHSAGIKMKSFLCSRDIQVGDEVLALLTNEKFIIKDIDDTTGRKYYIAFGHLCPAENAVKVIGEISPNATWVKEGDEFEEEGIEIVYREVYNCLCKKRKGYEDEDCSEYSGGTNKYVDGCYRKDKLIWYIKIKCPSCKTFH